MAVKIAVLGGWNIPPAAMAPTIEGLRSHCQCPVTLLSYPGYDGAYSGPESWQTDALLARWASVIDPDTLLVGWSLGGMIAMHIASSTPVAGVVTLGSNIRFHGDAPWQMPTPVFRSFSRNVRKNYSAACLTFVDLVLSGDHAPEPLLKTALIASYREFAPNVDSINDSLALLGTLDISSRPVDCPQLLVFADSDALVPVACAAQIPENSCTTVRIVSGSHDFAFSPDVWREIQNWRLNKMTTIT